MKFTYALLSMAALVEAGRPNLRYVYVWIGVKSSISSGVRSDVVVASPTPPIDRIALTVSHEAPTPSPHT